MTVHRITCPDHDWEACMTRDGRCWVCALARAAGLDAKGARITAAPTGPEPRTDAAVGR